MRIEEKIENNILTIDFYTHKSLVKREIINITGKNPEEIFNAKILLVKELSESIFLKFNGKEKEIIKEWGKIDENFKDLYKKLYPVGGWRNGGRPKGTKTEKTTMLKVRITPEEEKFLLEQLEKYRENKNKQS